MVLLGCSAEVWIGAYNVRRCLKRPKRELVPVGADWKRLPVCATHYRSGLLHGAWLFDKPGAQPANWYAPGSLRAPAEMA